MVGLPSVQCKCKRILESDEFEPNARGGARRATNYESCLRRCDNCGIGFSNANTADISRLTIIYRDPLGNLPELSWPKNAIHERFAQSAPIT